MANAVCSQQTTPYKDGLLWRGLEAGLFCCGEIHYAYQKWGIN